MRGIILEQAKIATPQIIEDKGTSIVFNANLQDVDVTNRNKRIYPREVIETGLQAEYLQERLSTRTLYGEAGHPLSQDPTRILNIAHERISHIIHEVWFEGDILRGRVETALTPLGTAMMGLIRQGSRVAFSLRAHGKTVPGPNGTVIVEAPIMILTWDWVVHPSHASAYMDVLSESSSVIPAYLGSVNHQQLFAEGVMYESPEVEAALKEQIKTGKTGQKIYHNLVEAGDMRTLENYYVFKESDKKGIKLIGRNIVEVTRMEYDNEVTYRMRLDEYVKKEMAGEQPLTEAMSKDKDALKMYRQFKKKYRDESKQKKPNYEKLSHYAEGQREWWDRIAKEDKVKLVEPDTKADAKEEAKPDPEWKTNSPLPKKSDKDHDGDGKVESPEAEYKGSVDKAINNKEELEEGPKLDTLGRIAKGAAKIAIGGAAGSAVGGPVGAVAGTIAGATHALRSNKVARDKRAVKEDGVNTASITDDTLTEEVPGLAKIRCLRCDSLFQPKEEANWYCSDDCSAPRLQK